MGYGHDGLTFRALREANIRRNQEFYPGCETWTPSQWLQALVGEIGEYANLMKKVERGDFSLDEARPDIANELADVQIYLDILADKVGVDLGRATTAKWNAVCERRHIPMVLRADDWHYTEDRPHG